MRFWAAITTWVLGFTLGLSVFAAPADPPAASAGKSREFDLEARKQKQKWLWETPNRQEIPRVRGTSWPAQAEDFFILEKLESAGLSPAADADDRTWLRRAHFVITGIPPSPDEIQAFLRDTSVGARQRAVDRLLASPQFGERWARHWLDLMRYAESRGHESDFIIANAWHYRDYVIRAMNEDVRYDQFLVEHLAGDLLQEPRLRPDSDSNESVLGTGWAFLGEENHSPVDIRQDECERIDNKVDVFSKTFLGLTVSCARCHDHKFDPIRSQDYYALSGFFLSSRFRQVRFESMENHRRIRIELDALRSKALPGIASAVRAGNAPGISEVAGHLLAALPLYRGGSAATDSHTSPRVAGWIEQLRQAETNRGHPLHGLVHPPAESASTTVTRPVALPAGARVIADYRTTSGVVWKADGEAFGTGPIPAGTFLFGEDSGNPVLQMMPHGAARRDLFWKHLTMAPGNQDDAGSLAATSRAGQMLQTPTFTLESGKLHYLIRGKTRVYAAVDSHLMIAGPLHGNLVKSLGVDPEKQPEWVTHNLADYRGHRTHLEFGPDGTNGLEILMVVESETTPARTAAEPIWIRGTSDVERAQSFQDALGIANSGNSAAHAGLANWMWRHPGLFQDRPDPNVARVTKEFLAAQTQLANRVRWSSRTAVAWFDGTGVDENLLMRGKPTQPGPASPRSLPVAFTRSSPIRSESSSGRRELAQQLVDVSNPLVARVIANRVWHHVFGRGIVASVDNFGELGDRPSHPALLDHLAWRFVHEKDWSIKRLVRDLVLSRTFGMDSRSVDVRAEERDPDNILLHRMPVRRLEAEAIRDALLEVSGRLNSEVGGSPVEVHLTEFVIGRGRPDKGGPLDGNGRRSLYTALRRNFMPTLMQTFDVPTPFSTIGRRNVTNVPGQALARMNDALFHEQARVWVQRLFRELPNAGGPDRIRWLFECAYGRLPTAGESADCLASIDEFRSLRQDSPAADVGAWTDLCHALLNANDFIYVK